jgi:SAM-dependent methyltransferase
MIDTFGIALMDYFNDPESVHILERDDGYINIIKTSTYFTEYDNWNPVEQELAKLVEGRILDVGCGSGRCMVYFQEKGIDAVGIDYSKLAIKASKRLGLVNCMVMDAMNLDFPENSFDTAGLFGNGLGLCGLEGSKKMLQELSKVVKPKGLLVASSRDVKITTNPQHYAYHQRNREQGKPIGLIRLRVNFREIKGDWFNLYMLEPHEVESYIKKTGWSLERIIESEDPANPIYGVVLRNS